VLDGRGDKDLKQVSKRCTMHTRKSLNAPAWRHQLPIAMLKDGERALESIQQPFRR
jgi:hypothetical protein